ncbi:S8 family serine peptidase [Neopusillimonas aromaticivorans]|uniref:S8 family serine peptidase n=1 Tax=Neopusillimonas aromaticivorans TaxID=2979868 RepID=UPI0025957398|nr:S8 family serine peptidase [Neopusillimonas aromaticivorans]WJJ94942.1 S8 family serine peptidase [Neopusillimonas aromaticivorans]
MSPSPANIQTPLRLTVCSRSGKWLERLIFIGLLFVGLGVCGNASSQSAASFETPDYLNQRGLGLINASEAYRLGYTGKGVTLGIVDSGIEPLHPKFSGQLTGGYDFMRNQPITPTSGMDSGVGHGTHVSAIMAGRRDGQEMHGVAFNASFLMARYGVFGINPEDDEEEDEEGDETASYTTAASFLDQAFSRSWNYYADKNIGIINNSIGVNVCDRGEAGSAIQPCNVLDFGLRSKGDTNFFFMPMNCSHSQLRHFMQCAIRTS